MRALSLIVFAFALIGLGIGLSNSTDLFKDSKEYLALSENLKEHATHYAGNLSEEIDMRLYNKRPPGYSAFLGINSGEHQLLSRFLQFLLTLLNFFIGLGILRLIHSDKRTLVLYTIFFALGFSFLLTSGFIMADLFLCTLISLIVHQLILYRKSKQIVSLRWISLLLTLAVLTKPVVLPLVLIASVYLASVFLIKNSHWALLLPLSVLLVVFSLNYSRFGFLHYSSISAINLSQYNAGLLPDKTTHEGIAISSTTEEYRAYNQRVTSEAKNTIRTNFGEYISIHLTGSLKMLVDPGRFEIYSSLGNNNPEEPLTPLVYQRKWAELWTKMKGQFLPFSIFLFLLILSFIKLLGLFLSLGYIKKAEIALMILVLAYFVGITGPIGAFRFLIPVYVPLPHSKLGRYFQLFKILQERS